MTKSTLLSSDVMGVSSNGDVDDNKVDASELRCHGMCQITMTSTPGWDVDDNKVDASELRCHGSVSSNSDVDDGLGRRRQQSRRF